MAMLTNRQQEVVRLLAQGHNQQEIARKLGLSYSSVRQYVYAARGRTGIKSTVALVVTAVRDEDGQND